MEAVERIDLAFLEEPVGEPGDRIVDDESGDKRESRDTERRHRASGAAAKVASRVSARARRPFGQRRHE